MTSCIKLPWPIQFHSEDHVPLANLGPLRILSGPQFLRAVGAEFVRLHHLAFAVGAGRMKIVFAVGAEIEACADGLSALWTRVGQRLAHQEIDDEADEAPGGQKKNHE